MTKYGHIVFVHFGSNFIFQETSIYNYNNPKLGFGHVFVIWHNWSKIGPNMGVSVGARSPRPPQKFGQLLYNEIRFYKNESGPQS